MFARRLNRVTQCECWFFAIVPRIFLCSEPSFSIASRFSLLLSIDCVCDFNSSQTPKRKNGTKRNGTKWNVRTHPVWLTQTTTATIEEKNNNNNSSTTIWFCQRRVWKLNFVHIIQRINDKTENQTDRTKLRKGFFVYVYVCASNFTFEVLINGKKGFAHTLFNHRCCCYYCWCFCCCHCRCKLLSQFSLSLLAPRFVWLLLKQIFVLCMNSFISNFHQC